jgi:regulator of RNase E activity RraA
MPSFASEDLETLAQWDTPTICNGLELLDAQYRTSGFTTQNMVCLDPKLAPIVGYARTATIQALVPADGDAPAVRARRARYYEHIAESPLPSIAVVQDVDPEPGFGAFWGEVNTAIHLGLGCLGSVTNGSFRDVDACAPGFQLLGGRIGPSHAWVHLVEISCEVNVFSMIVKPDEIVHADRHGAVVVPADCVRRLPAAIDLLTRREAVILSAARRSDFNVDILEQAMSDSAEIH